MSRSTNVLSLIAGATFLVGSPLSPCHAENYTTNIINGVLTNAGSTFIVGDTGSFNHLEIRNAGSVTNQTGVLGKASTASNNSALVTGSASLWQNSGTLVIGDSGSYNRLTVTNSGKVSTTNLIISAKASASNNLVLLAGGNLLATNVTVGELGAGQLIVSNGVLTSRQMFVGSNAFSVGTLTIEGGTVSNAATLTVGALSNATGAIWLKSGFLNTTSSVYVGRTGTGSMTVSNGVFQAGGVSVGLNGTSHGTFSQSGGTVTLRNSMTVGVVSGTTGTMWMTGGQFWATNGTLQIGFSGAGLLTVSNALMSLSDFIVRDTANLEGATVNYRNTLDASGAAPSGFASLWLKNGALNPTTTNAGFFVGLQTSGRVTASNSMIGASSSIIGYLGGNGTLTLVDSSLTLSTNLYIALSGTGAVWLAGGQITQTNTLTLIGSGVGTMVVSNGIVDFSDVRLGGSFSGSIGTLTAAGGTIRANTAITVGDCVLGGMGIIDLEGGALFVTNAAHSAKLDVQKGSVVLNSGTLVVDQLVMTNSCGHFVRTGGFLSIGSTNLGAGLDADGDGLANDWESMYGMNPLSSAGTDEGSQDQDGDGFSNLQEFQAGTDPTNSASAFRITSVSRNGSNVVVTWSSGLGKTNALEISLGNNGNYTTNGFASIFAVTNTVATTTNYLDVGAATNSVSKFYRVRLVP